MPPAIPAPLQPIFAAAALALVTILATVIGLAAAGNTPGTKVWHTSSRIAALRSDAIISRSSAQKFATGDSHNTTLTVVNEKEIIEVTDESESVSPPPKTKKTRLWAMLTISATCGGSSSTESLTLKTKPKRLGQYEIISHTTKSCPDGKSSLKKTLHGFDVHPGRTVRLSQRMKGGVFLTEDDQVFVFAPAKD